MSDHFIDMAMRIFSKVHLEIGCYWLVQIILFDLILIKEATDIPIQRDIEIQMDTKIQRDIKILVVPNCIGKWIVHSFVVYLLTSKATRNCTRNIGRY